MKRRALLSTLGGSYLTLTAGCLSDQNGTTDTPANTQTTVTSTATTSSADTETETPKPNQRVGIGVKNEDDKEYTLSIQVRDNDKTLLDRSVDVNRGPSFGTSVEGDLVGEGAYRVTAELDTGAALDYEWRVTDVARSLSIVITDEGTLEPRQQLAEGGGETLPYSVAGTKDIFSPPSVEVRNESDEDAMLTVAIEYDGDRFFEHTFNAETDRAISTPPIVKSHATYDVFVEAADGRSATYEWNIPENWAWPTLAVLVAEDGTLRVGCSWPGGKSISVENTDGTDHEVTLTLSDGDEAVTETTQAVSPGDSELSFDIPIGDEYELTIETDDGSETVRYTACYCLSTRVTVTLEDGNPVVEAVRYWCD